MPLRPPPSSATTGLVIGHDRWSGALAVRNHGRSGVSAGDGESLGAAGIRRDGGTARQYAPVPSSTCMTAAAVEVMGRARRAAADGPSTTSSIRSPLGPLSTRANETEFHLVRARRRARHSGQDLERLIRARRALEWHLAPVAVS